MNNQLQYTLPMGSAAYPYQTAPYFQQGGPSNMNYTITQYMLPDYRYTEALLQWQAENIKLKNQLEQKILREEELKRVFQMQGNAYFSIMASGRPVQLTHFIFDKVEHVVYDPFYGRRPQIRIKVSTQEKPGLIDLDDFWNDKKWICFLEQISHTPIKIYGSIKQVALLLRSIANERMTRIFVPYFGGWIGSGSNYQYCTFTGFRTAARRTAPEFYEAACAVLPANIKMAADRFLSRFAPIQNKPLRSFLIIWLHLSFLQTLLQENGIRLTKIPVILAENPAVQAYLRSILTLSPDGLLNMNQPPDDFALSLACRKDQPCVILPPAFGKNAMANERILDEALYCGMISRNKKRSDLARYYLRTLPVLLTERAVSLAFSFGIPIVAASDNFDAVYCAAAAENVCLTDYWSGFLSFTHLHMDQLRSFLKQQMTEALAFSTEYQYTAEHAAVLGAMWGVAEFIRLFARELSFSDHEMLTDSWLDYTIELLEEGDAQCAAPEGMADSFLSAVQRAIQQKSFPCYPLGQQMPSLLRGAIYFNDEYICLDRTAFDRICQVAGYHPAAVKRDLLEQGYFTGKAVNRQSYETRISVYCKGTGSKLICVYKFRRDLFEHLGEPSLFQEV